MFYELVIALSSVLISFNVYLGFLKIFENNPKKTESDDDEIILDEYVDLESKELVNLVMHFLDVSLI